MGLKEYIKDGLVIIGFVGSLQLAENYLPLPDAQRREYHPMYPRATSKVRVEIDLGAALVDDDCDGSPDRKSIVLAGNHGFHRWELPITSQDTQTFMDLTSRLR